MTRKFDRKRQRRSETPGESDFSSVDAGLTKEKQKARELKHTPWWKKKISTGVCYYCGRAFSPSELTMDHKIPLSRGGRTEKINIVAACKECNNRKKYLLPAEWEEYISNIQKVEMPQRRAGHRNDER